MDTQATPHQIARIVEAAAKWQRYLKWLSLEISKPAPDPALVREAAEALEWAAGE
jgi:hypothetical protein